MLKELTKSTQIQHSVVKREQLFIPV